MDFVGQGSLDTVFLLPGNEGRSQVALAFDEFTALQERPHLLSLVCTHLPLFEGFGNGSRVEGLSQVLCPQATILLLRRIHLPSHEPVLRRFLLNAGILHGRMMLLYVGLLFLPRFLYLAHLFGRLHLEHTNVLVFLLAPLGHGRLQTELVVKGQQAVRAFTLANGQV